MSGAWSGGSDTRWRRFRADLFRQWAKVGRVECEIRGPKCTGRSEEPDHIQPLALGGAKYDPANCRPACAVCNRGRRPTLQDEPAHTSVSKW